MRKSFAVLSVAFATTCVQAELELYGSSGFLRESVNAWPPVQYPYNFQLKGAYYTFNEETKQLVPYENLTVDQSVDSDKNRQKAISNVNLGPYFGQGDVINYLNFTTGILTQNIPKLSYCKQVDLGQKVNITDMIEKIRDPSSGLSKYLGLEALPWTGGFKLHHFTIQQDGNLQHIYYCPKSLNLKYMFIENQTPQLILYSENGFLEKTFTDADFAGLDACHSSLVRLTSVLSIPIEVPMPRFF